MRGCRSRLCLVFLVMVLGLGLGTSAFAAKEPIRIGLQAPITGQWAYEGEMALNCVQIVADEINAKGGVLGRPIEIVPGDDQCSPKQSALVAQRMLSEKVVAVIGTYGSSVTEPAATIYERAGLLNIAYGSTAEQLTAHGWKFFFRTCFRDDRQGAFFAQFVNDTLKLKRVAILHDNTTFAKGLAEAARRSLEQAKKAEIVFYDAVTPGERDFTPVLSRMQATKPEVVYYTGYYPEAGLIIRQMRDLGSKAVFVGGNAAINDEFISIAGLEIAKGALMTQEPMPTDLRYPEAKPFLDEYVRRHKAPPSSPWPVYAADALKVIAAAIEATKSTDSKVLADYIRNRMKDLPGITGPISFDDAGDREGAIYLAYEVTADGKFKPYQP
ncbi:MAG: branched-chain amino acid ABC transporter substrate-binding protein [Bacillota bacterium]|nr:branched-chain amino acid ABC transporter substrate-binding protein [Bacillota bacterium]